MTLSDQTSIIRLDEIEDGRAVQDYLLEKTGQRSVPNIFINQKHVGGTFLQELFASQILLIFSFLS